MHMYFHRQIRLEIQQLHTPFFKQRPEATRLEHKNTGSIDLLR